MPGISTQCLGCARYRGMGSCPAFPVGGIPEEIWGGEFDHEQPWPDGDNGFQFVPQAEQTPEELDVLRYPPDGIPT